MIVPPLRELVRHLGEMPAAFRGPVRLRAVAADLIESLTGSAPPAGILDGLEAAGPTAAEENRRRWILAACHLLWHPSFRVAPMPADRLDRFLVHDLAVLSGIVSAGELDNDEDRREELVRRAMRALDLRLPGESSSESEDRFRQVDSIERRRVLVAAAERERRAREVREAMARKAAEEAAAKVSRE